MTCLITFLVVLVVAFLVAPWVLAAIQYRRQREQSSRLATLEGELARLAARLDRVPPRAAAIGVENATSAADGPAAGAEAPPPVPPPIVGTPAIAAPGRAAVPDLPVAAVPSPFPAASVAATPALPSVAAVPLASAAAAPLGATSGGALEATIAAGAVISPAAPPPPAAGAPPPGSAAGAEPPGGGAPRIEWERWIGVRGAAVLGGVVLALAGILFVRYTIERGLISPAVRIAMGILTGLAAIAWSQRLRPRGYRINAGALAGAGIVLLYAAVWAAHALYGFVGAAPAYALMSLITVACGVLSWRNESLLTAVLGLAGGFATPFLLATSSDNPLGLFGYVLLLDLGLIGLARRRGWSALAILALLGTVFYQGFWMVTRMDAGETLLMLGVLGLFALVFGFAGGRGRRGEVAAAPPSFGWIAAEATGLLAPFAFALYLASRADLGPRLYPVAALLLLLSVAAQWVGRRHGGSDLLSSGAAAGSLAVVVVWSWDVVWTPGLVWEAVAICVMLAAAFQLFLELDLRASRRRVPETARPDLDRGDQGGGAGDAGGRAERTGAYASAPAPPTLSSLVAVVGFLALLVLNSFDATDSPWPWLLGAALTAAMVARQSVDDRRAFTPLIAAIGLGTVVAGWFLVARDEPTMPAVELYFGMAVLVAVALQLAALAREHGPARRFSEIGAAVYPAILLFALAIGGAGPPPIEAGVFLTLTVLFALMLVLAVTRLGSGAGYLIGMLVLAFTHTAWSVSETARGAALLVLVVFGALVAAFALWPSLAPKLARSTAAWRASALAAPFWFWSMTRLYESRFGDDAIALVPVVLAAITLGAAYRGRRTWDAEDAAARTSHLAWFGAIVLGLAAIAVPLQLDKEWITVGWALEGLAVTALWRRLDHPGLKWFGSALFAAVTARLLLNPEVLTYHDREGLPVLNWLAYTYLVPAACLLGAARILGAAAPRDETVYAPEPGTPLAPPAGSSGGADAAAVGLALEVARARSWEEPIYSSLRPLLAAGLVVAAILVVFAWINLTIIDAFATGPTLALSLDRMPARDLTLSLAWVVYAVTLLGYGMARDSGALRWLSLGFLVLSIGKVFLYDLGELKDLYRVASLVGLAFSLILVSLAYQRFVFRRGADPAV